VIRLEDVQHNPDVEVLMKKVHEYLATMLAITHDEEHAHHVANLSYRILKILDYPEELSFPKRRGSSWRMSPWICLARWAALWWAKKRPQL
jgi:hypothetical protein